MKRIDDHARQPIHCTQGKLRRASTWRISIKQSRTRSEVQNHKALHKEDQTYQFRILNSYNFPQSHPSTLPSLINNEHKVHFPKSSEPIPIPRPKPSQMPDLSLQNGYRHTHLNNLPNLPSRSYQRKPTSGAEKQQNKGISIKCPSLRIFFRKLWYRSVKEEGNLKECAKPAWPYRREGKILFVVYGVKTFDRFNPGVEIGKFGNEKYHRIEWTRSLSSPP